MARRFFVFCCILTVESDLRRNLLQIALNFIALIASIRLTFLLCLWAEAEFLRTIPICKLVGTAIGATKWSVVFCTTWHIINERDKVVYDRWFVGHIPFCKYMCPVSDALFIEFWTVSPRHTTKEVVDSRGNTFLYTKAQFHLMGNSHDTVIDGCSLFGFTSVSVLRKSLVSLVAWEKWVGHWPVPFLHFNLTDAHVCSCLLIWSGRDKGALAWW